MSIFEAVKQSVTTRQAAKHFGIRAGRNGMCRCPFHADRNPSMKVDRRYYCFGCGATGDVIDFVSRLEGISPRRPPFCWRGLSLSPMRTRGRPAGAAPCPGRKARSSSSAAWSGTACGCCATTATGWAAGSGTMPPRGRRKNGILCLWKPCKSRTMWNICWTRCSPPTWRNGRP